MESNATEIPYGHCHCGCGGKTSIAKRSYKHLGHVKGQPVRFMQGHRRRDSAANMPMTEQDRGYETPCHIWQAALDSHGYGVKRINYVQRPAHEVAWVRANGPVPSGRVLDHLCRNRACINPAHLEPVTHIENCQRGAAAKLTARQVAEIKSRRGELHRELAVEFGVTRATIASIHAGRSWANIEPAAVT